MIKSPHAGRDPRRREYHRKTDVKEGKDEVDPVPEEYRGRFDPYLQVVLPVHEGVDGVIGGRPEYVGHEYKLSGGIDPPPYRGPRHYRAPAEGYAQEHLRKVAHSFYKGVYYGEEYADEGKHYRKGVEEKDKGKGERGEGEKHKNSLLYIEPSACQGPGFCSFDVTVEVPVSDVVGRAPGAPHEERPEYKYRKELNPRPALGGYKKRPERGPEDE